jgi:hypothetical protein
MNNIKTINIGRIIVSYDNPALLRIDNNNAANLATHQFVKWLSTIINTSTKVVVGDYGSVITPIMRTPEFYDIFNKPAPPCIPNPNIVRITYVETQSAPIASNIKQSTFGESMSVVQQHIIPICASIISITSIISTISYILYKSCM